MGKKRSRSKTRLGRKNYTTKLGNKVYRSRYVKKTHPYSYRKGNASKTHLGLLDYTTKLGDVVFHQNSHYVKKSRRPYSTTTRRTRR